MRFSDFVTASLVAPFVAAHGNGIPGAPKIFGLGPDPIAKLKGLSSRISFDGQLERRILPQQGPQLVKRQGGDAQHRCGPEGDGAICDEGFCCSSSGYCGQGKSYCKAPDCLFQFGPGCDANHTPDGGSTKDISRPQLGEIAYGGTGVFKCKVPGTVAITYDDGPFIYTDDVLDQFKSYDAKATFFITGNNIGKGPIDDPKTDWPAVIRRMANEGHQVASHTWSHQDLSKITKEQRHDQIVKNEMAIRNIIGKFPTYMRPPYSSCTKDSGCEDDMKELGYVLSYFWLDTDDYNQLDNIQVAKDNFEKKVGPSDPKSEEWLTIAHDIHEQTALNLTGYMLELIKDKGFKAVTMGECLGEPEDTWYRGGPEVIAGASSGTSSSATASGTGSASGTAADSVTSPTATPNDTTTDRTRFVTPPVSTPSSPAASTTSSSSSTPSSVPESATDSPSENSDAVSEYMGLGGQYGWLLMGLLAMAML